MFFLFTTYSSSESWVTDGNTGKQYLVLATSTLDVLENTKTCASHNAILPEPRTEAENNFLDSLNAQAFPLGMDDVDQEGVWRWNSDGSPVTWQYWAKFSVSNGAEPNGGGGENCVVMVKHIYQEKRLTSTASWGDVRCQGQQISPKSLVCQKPEGMYTSEDIKTSLQWMLRHICQKGT